MRIQYIGKKDQFIDRRYGTHAYFEPGSIVELAEDKARSLLAHKDIFQIAPAFAKENIAPLVATPQPQIKPVKFQVDDKDEDDKYANDEGDKLEIGPVETPESSSIVDAFDRMNDDEIKSFAREHDLKIDFRFRGQKLRNELRDALKAQKTEEELADAE
jgi:hypothetical protein